MPNWVKNIVRVPEKIMPKIKEKYFEGDRLSFNKIIPMPECLNITDGSITTNAIIYALSLKDENERDILAKKLKSIRSNLFFGDVREYFSDERNDYLKEIAQKYIPFESERNLGINTLEEFGNHCINNLLSYNCLSWYDWHIKNWGTKWDIEYCKTDEDTIIFQTAWSVPVEVLSELSKAFPAEVIEVEFADEDIGSDNVGSLQFLNGDIVSDEMGDTHFAREVWDYDIDLEKSNDNEFSDIEIKTLITEERKEEIFNHLMDYVFNHCIDDKEVYTALTDIIGLNDEEIKELGIIFEEQEENDMEIE